MYLFYMSVDKRICRAYDYPMELSPSPTQVPPSGVPPLVPASPIPSRKPIIIVVAVCSLILLFCGAYYAYTKMEEKKALAKYEVDTDKDSIPDFVELGIGSDPNESEYIRCDKNACASEISKPKKLNIIIALDSSGSMALQNGTKTRMEAAKSALRSYISKISGKASVGLLVYGHKGSNSVADKGASCAGAEMIAGIGSLTPSSVDSYLSSLKPVGWTPSGLAIRTAAEAFRGKEGDNNVIVLVTDGDETCDSKPAEAAREVYNSSSKIRVDVIGFAVDSRTQTILNEVSSAGGGRYGFASNEEDLIRSFDTATENWGKIREENACLTNAYVAFLACYGSKGVMGKAQSFLMDRTKLFNERKISRAETKRIYDLLDQMEAFQNKSVNEARESNERQINESKKRLIN